MIKKIFNLTLFFHWSGFTIISGVLMFYFKFGSFEWALGAAIFTTCIIIAILKIITYFKPNTHLDTTGQHNEVKDGA